MKNILLLNIDLSSLALVRYALVQEGYNVIALPQCDLLTDYLRWQTPDLAVLPQNDEQIYCMFQQVVQHRAIPVLTLPGSLSLLLSEIGRRLGT